jgi:hypothetical protein
MVARTQRNRNTSSSSSVIPVTAFPDPPRPDPTSTNTSTRRSLKKQQQTNHQRQQRAPKSSCIPKLRPRSHAHRPRSQRVSSAGQCVNGACSYPISRNMWMRSAPARSDTPIECTGASPQRCRRRTVVSPIRTCRFVLLVGGRTYLVVETAVALEVLEKRRVGLAAPKVHIANLKVAPNCFASGA